MQINLQDLAAKRVRSAEGLTVSDHTIDLAKFTGSELIFTGTGSRGLVIKNAKQVQVTFKDAIIDNAGTGVTLKFDGVTQQVSVSGYGAKLFGKSGNSASQMIYFVGVHSDITLSGFEIDQRRDGKSGSTVTGACVQFAGVPESSLKTVGKIYLNDLIIRNAGDEGVYVNHFKKVSDAGVRMADGEELNISSVQVYRSGRDYIQWRGFSKARVTNCYGENGGLEANPDHYSALSINGDTQEFIIENSKFNNVAQLAYVGSGKGLFTNVIYDQGTHAGSRSNQAIYTKGTIVLKNTMLIAPYAKRSVVCADGGEVIYDLSDQFIGPRMDYVFNGGKFIEQPLITTRTAEVIEERTSAGVKYFLNWNGQRIEL